MKSIFLSYSKKDIKASLEFEKRLKQSEFIVYRDKSSLSIGENWKDELFLMIQKCDYFLLLWSENSSESTVVYEEIIEAIKHQKKILPCILDGTLLTPLIKESHFFELKKTISEEFEKLLNEFNLEKNISQVEDLKEYKHIISTYKSIVKKKFKYFKVLFEGRKEEIKNSYIQLNLINGLDGNSKRGISSKDLIELLHKPRSKYVIAGHPGAGKTSFHYYLMHQWANSTSNTITIYNNLQNFDHTLYNNFSEFILDQLSELFKFQKHNYFKNLKIFDNYSCLILLDGLDEIPSGNYEVFKKQLTEFSNTYRSCSFVITTRINGFRGKKEEDFLKWKIYSITKLDELQIKDFISNWFRNVNKEEVLLEKIKEPRIKELAGRAFLLALICLVFEERSELGNNRSELYEQATRYLEGSRLINLSNSLKQFRKIVLKEIALKYLQLNSQEINSEILMSIVNNVLKDNIDTSPKLFLDSIAKDTGILQNLSSTYIFTHKSFQEYYSALALKDLPNGVELILDYCQVSEWEEPIKLYAGTLTKSNNQENFITYLWKKNPALALRTYSECQEISSKFIANLISNSTQGNRLRMLDEIQMSLRSLDKKESNRIIIETLTPLFLVETDSSVLFFGIELLKEFDPKDAGKIMYNTFYKDAKENLNKLLSNKKYRFEFIKAKDGDFKMGSNTSKDKIERPEHKVILSSFDICKYQLTNLAYECILGIENSKRDEWVSSGDNQPVINLNWYDAYIFGLKIDCRLPTEAEWEFATRAGSIDNWHFGNNKNELEKYANYEDLGLNRTWDVGSGLSNNWGLFDTHGNVWEWCQDWLDFYQENIQLNPKGPKKGSKKVRRGGGHAYHARGCQSSFRWGNDPSYSFKDIGVRFVRN